MASFRGTLVSSCGDCEYATSTLSSSWFAKNVNIFNGRELITSTKHCLNTLRETRPNDYNRYVEKGCPDATVLE